MAKAKFDLKKIDFTKVKQFFLAKGEKVALAAFAVIGCLLVVTGLMGAMSVDGRKQAKDIRDNTDKIRQMYTAEKKIDRSEIKINTNWIKRLSDFVFAQMVGINDGLPPKRSSPTVK